MSRLAKYKLEKTKVKVVFRLQFHATHIPQTGWDKLFISLIPADSGKATGKTTKANVKNGTCKWGDPIYETTRLLQDAKNKCFDEKLYKIVVAMGTSRSSILGETNINLADYANASKPSAVGLPLHGSDSATILHVTVQLLTSKTGFREFEQQREIRERGLQTTTDQNSHDESLSGKVPSSVMTANDQIDKVNARVRFKPESRLRTSLEEEVGLNEEYSDSAIGFDGSSNTSGSLYAEKHDTSSTQEIESSKSTVSGDVGGHSHSQSPRPGKGDLPDHRFMAQGSNDWVPGWGSDYSIDNDSAIAYEENSRLRGSLEVAESSILELKFEVSSLQSHADEIATETQKFAHQLATEITSGGELAKEVSLLKSECSNLKGDLERLKDYKLSTLYSSRGSSSDTEQDHLFQNLQIKWFKGLLVMEDKVRGLQNKACLGFHEKDFGFLNSDLEALLNVLRDIKQGTGQTVTPNIVPSERANVKEIGEMNVHQSQQFVSGHGFDLNLYQPEDMLHSLSIPGLISHEADSVDATNVMRGNFFELLKELEESKAERESLARKADQMECYYEALIHELEENQKQMLGELQNLRNEHSTCLYTISSSKSQMETMRLEMDDQIFRFAEDKRDLDALSKELERRAITSEAALKRARLNYSIAVEQLQKDLELLSLQVLSVFKTNENLIKEAFPEASQPAVHGDPATVQNQNLDSGTSDAFKPLHCQDQSAGVRKQLIGGDMILEDLKRSLHLQEELYQKVEEELFEMHLANIHLDVFSKALQETLLEATADSRSMKDKMDELNQHLEYSTESKDLLMQRLQNAMEDVHALNEYKDSCLAKCNDMALQSQILEAKLESVSSENCLLTRKITEWEAMVIEGRNYKSKYEACAAERTELASLLKHEAMENGSLRNEISSLQGRLKFVENECDDIISLKENLQNIVNFLQDKLRNLLVTYDKQLSGVSLLSKPLDGDLEFKDFMSVVLQLEELQKNACGKILQLMEEKKGLEAERDVALVSSRTAKSEILSMEKKFEHDVQDMVNKLDVSNALVQKLQLDHEAFADRLKLGSKAEEEFAQLNRELVSDLACLEVELQEVTLKNNDLAQEILALETVTEELGRSRLAISEIAQKNHALMISLQKKTEDSVKLALELKSLNESFKCVRDELHVERGFRDKLEGTITELTSQLNDRKDQFHSDLQKAELFQFKQMVSDLELEKSRLNHLLMQSEECLKKYHEESSSIIHLEAELSEMHKLVIAADVKFVFLRIQYGNQIQGLSQQIQSSDRQVGEVHKKHLDVETALSCCLTREAHCIEENTKLMKALESMRSELEASAAQNSVLLNLNSAVKLELEEYKNMAGVMETSYLKDQNQHALELQQLKRVQASSEEEIDNMMFSNEALEIEVLLLKAKLDELQAQITLLEGYNDEVLLLQNQCNELTQKLSEQIMKTEEYKNLSIHLKELKGKAETECLQARAKREAEGSSFAMQDSLRIAFIKEQYETKLQELKHQLSISKKHGEEMLWKLQDTIDEVENRKRSEVSHIKINEALSTRIMELETELQTVLSDKRERVKACDRIQAELECSLISLECCKEEKEKLEASLQDCMEEKTKIEVELALMKNLLENSATPMNIQEDGSDGSPKYPSNRRTTMDMVPRNRSTVNMSPKYLDQDSTGNCEAAENTCSVPTDECEHLSALMNVQIMQDTLSSRGVHGIPGRALVDQRNALHNDSKHLALINDNFNTLGLKSSMDHLHNELEKMKNENALLSRDVHHFDPNLQGLQEELMQLDKANEELGSKFPLYNEFSGGGNALERVLALEIELAEALQSKNKSSIQFQSSFLKQHSDEEAVFKSFRDINELIKDMLHIKGRYAGVETELKEMHDRYSQLSLQFAEVEGERQQLMMTLKNVRASKKLLQLNRSSSATLGDISS